MTVTYTQKVSDCKGFGSFWRLLFRCGFASLLKLLLLPTHSRLLRWRGSVYKLVWPDTLVYCFLYFICSMVYRFGLNNDQRGTFEQLSLYCDYFRNLIPISFVLGFYVSVVVQRWWEQYLCIPWPDDFALFCTAYIKGKDGQPKLLRSTLLRYINLTFAMTFSKISGKVKKKFPSVNSLLDAGYLTAEEMRILENQGTKSQVPLTSLPLMWCSLLIEKGRTQGYIRDDFGMRKLIDELGRLRDKSGMLLRWTDISIPLVYTQVATMAVYSFFFFSVLGRQFLDPNKHYENRTIDFFVPIFTLLQFFFYMGWLKVAESLVNPFGEDDDDFDLDLILDRHFEMSYLLGNVTMTEEPSMVKDINSMMILTRNQMENIGGRKGGYRRHSEIPIPTSCQIKLDTNGKLPKTATLQPARSSSTNNLPVKPTSLLTNPSVNVKPTAMATRLPGSSPANQTPKNVQQPGIDSILTPALSPTTTQPSSTNDPTNPFDFLWEEMDVNQATDDLSSALDNTPILPSRSGCLEVNSPSISAATTPTEDVNINYRFADAQANTSHPGSDQIRSGQHRGMKVKPGHTGEGQITNSQGIDGHINPSYMD